MVTFRIDLGSGHNVLWRLFHLLLFIYLYDIVHRSITKVFLQEGRSYFLDQFATYYFVHNFSTGRERENTCCCLGKPERTFEKKNDRKKINVVGF